MVLMSSAEAKKATGEGGQHAVVDPFYTDPWVNQVGITCNSQRMLKQSVVQYQREDN